MWLRKDPGEGGGKKEKPRRNCVAATIELWCKTTIATADTKIHFIIMTHRKSILPPTDAKRDTSVQFLRKARNWRLTYNSLPPISVRKPDCGSVRDGWLSFVLFLYIWLGFGRLQNVDVREREVGVLVVKGLLLFLGKKIRHAHWVMSYRKSSGEKETAFTQYLMLCNQTSLFPQFTFYPKYFFATLRKLERKEGLSLPKNIRHSVVVLVCMFVCLGR